MVSRYRERVRARPNGGVRYQDKGEGSKSLADHILEAVTACATTSVSRFGQQPSICQVTVYARRSGHAILRYKIGEPTIPHSRFDTVTEATDKMEMR